MNTIKLFLTALLGMFLVACGGGGSSIHVPDAPAGVSVAVGPIVGTTASVSFTAPASDGGSAITGYTVTANPGGIASSGSITASGTASPIALTLAPLTAYTYSVVATNSEGNSTQAPPAS